jgi:hypothetical protein
MLGIRKAAALAVAASALLSGCGVVGTAAEKGSRSVIDLLRDDPEKSLRTAVDNAGKVTSVSLRVTGKEDGEPSEGKGTVTFGATPGGELTFNDAKDGPTTIRVVGKAFYFQIPAKDRTAPPFQGKNWMKMDLASLKQVPGVSADDIKQVGNLDEMLRQLNPSTQLKQMLDAGNFKAAGEEQVDHGGGPAGRRDARLRRDPQDDEGPPVLTAAGPRFTLTP